MIGFAFAGLLLGLILGVYCPFRVPPEYARLLAVAVMAGMDAVLGGVRASLEGNYDTQVFISGFFINGILAAFLCYAGNLIGIDLYLVAVLISVCVFSRIWELSVAFIWANKCPVGR